MNEHFESDPLDALRAADPVDPDRLPLASLARIRARVSEDANATSNDRRSTPWSARLVRLGAVAVGALVIVLVLSGGGKSPGLVPGASTTPGMAFCVEQYDISTLVNRSFAFDGTVAATSDDRVTFTVHRAYRGAAGGSITLDAPGMTGTAITSSGGPQLVVGARYLVAGDDHFVWGCGFTLPFDEAVAESWAAALAP